MKIKIKKISESPNANYPSAKKETYKCGHLPKEEVSLFVEYEAIGYVHEPPRVGSYLCMFRTERNGEAVGGILKTSIIKQVDGVSFSTENSIYKWEEIQE